MKEKIKIRYNYLFHFVEGDKRKLFKKAINHRRQETKLEDLKEEQSSHIKNSLKDNQRATLEECKEEETIIRTEIARLKTQRASLRDLVQYINVNCSVMIEMG
ncbi:hypothetical protein WA171_003882 [Blastocystis sp. BT1]